ncbi:MAG: hypothetical protein ACREB9_06290 [Thermoplasmata archaeon]
MKITLEFVKWDPVGRLIEGLFTVELNGDPVLVNQAVKAVRQLVHSSNEETDGYHYKER